MQVIHRHIIFLRYYGLGNYTLGPRDRAKEVACREDREEGFPNFEDQKEEGTREGASDLGPAANPDGTGMGIEDGHITHSREGE